MTQHTQTPSMPSPLWQYWRGLSGWNFYFLVKFGLLWAGYLNFHPLLNLVFMAFLLMPIPKYRLHRLRHWIAIPVGFALFWHDTWLPGPQSIMSQGTQVAEFSSGYLLDLIARFINWQMIGAIFVLLVAWLFLSQWIRVTVFVVAIMVWLNVLTLTGPVFTLWPAGQPTDTVTTTGVSKTADYKIRAQKLFDELDAFFTELEKSGRKVMVVVVPEHGGALKGDRMQISGLRDIPSPSITNVPAGVKFFGMKAPHEGAPIDINQPSSYLAISELVVRAVDGKLFTEDSVNWNKLTSNLPQTAPVSENANAVVIQYQGKPYVRLNGGDWVPYPQ
ncbi:TPA: cellulose biosynthesis protein BcsG [Salmonella enterica subsp. enterica serovar Typhi]